MLAAALGVALATAPGPAVAQMSPSTPHTGGISRVDLAIPTGRRNITTEATARINAASVRSTWSPGVAVVRPDTVWVPDRYVPFSGAPGPVFVPGHWERHLSEREVYVPPLAIVHPGGELGVVPAGVRAPADERLGP